MTRKDVKSLLEDEGISEIVTRSRISPRRWSAAFTANSASPSKTLWVRRP